MLELKKMMENENATKESINEDTALSEFIIRELSEHKIDVKLNDEWLNLFDIIETRLEEESIAGYYYDDFTEITFNNKKYYTISLEEKELSTTDYNPYLILDFNNKRVIRNAWGMMGNITESYWDEYGNELIINGEYNDVDFNNSSFIQLLMAGITYITAQSIINLREEGIITKEKINKLLESNLINDVYFLRYYHR